MGKNIEDILTDTWTSEDEGIDYMTDTGRKIDLFNPVSAIPANTKVKINEFVNAIDASDNLNDFLVQFGISRENQPRTYQTIVDIWKQSGEPSINTNPAKGLLLKITESLQGYKAAGEYNLFSNEIKTYGDEDLDILIEELAHPYEENGYLESGVSGKIKHLGRAAYDFLYDMATGDDRYEREGAMEHGVHEITSPQLHDRITNAIKIDFKSTFGQELDTDRLPSGHHSQIDFMNKKIADPSYNYERELEDWIKRVKMEDMRLRNISPELPQFQDMTIEEND